METKICPCGNSFTKKSYDTPYKFTLRKYCSRKCSAKFTNRKRSGELKIVVICSWCKAEFSRYKAMLRSKSGLYFCSTICKNNAQSVTGLREVTPESYFNGQRGYRSRAMKKYGPQCCQCNYSEDPRMLDVDHIDSDRSNNSIENLQVLCVWCHALKTRGVGSHPRSRIEYVSGLSEGLLY
jgi:hypothetical protein